MHTRWCWKMRMRCSVHEWLVLEDESTLPPVAGLHVVVCHPVVVVLGRITHHLHWHCRTDFVRNDGDTTQKEPVSPGEGTLPEHVSHSWGSSEHGTKTNGHSKNLNCESSCSSLSVIKFLLGQQILVWLSNDFISRFICLRVLLPAMHIVEVDRSHLRVHISEKFHLFFY